MAAPDIYPNSTDSSKVLYGTDERDSTGINAYMLERRKYYTEQQWDETIERFQTATTLYIGNLSFYTTEEQLYEFFSTVGPVKRIIMGLNRFTRTPCGFAFVEYYTHHDAIICHRHLHGAMCDERPITVSLDPGFQEGRQYGRSKRTGGQRRDDYRTEFDSGRGGYAANAAAQQLEHEKFTTLEQQHITGGFGLTRSTQHDRKRRGRHHDKRKSRHHEEQQRQRQEQQEEEKIDTNVDVETSDAVQVPVAVSLADDSNPADEEQKDAMASEENIDVKAE